MSDALSVWLAEVLRVLTHLQWYVITPLAGGVNGPLWRWVVVEQGIFVLFVGVGSLGTAKVLGARAGPRPPQRWGNAVVLACLLSLLWNWYSLSAVQAIVLGLHPQHGWEWTFLTWGLPLSLASQMLPGFSFTAQFGVGLVLGAGILFDLGRLLSWTIRSVRREKRQYSVMGDNVARAAGISADSDPKGSVKSTTTQHLRGRRS